VHFLAGHRTENVDFWRVMQVCMWLLGSPDTDLSVNLATDVECGFIGRTLSMSSPHTRSRQGLQPLHKHPVSTNCRYHLVLFLFIYLFSFLIIYFNINFISLFSFSHHYVLRPLQAIFRRNIYSSLFKSYF
jgi:hypothetical protein